MLCSKCKIFSIHLPNYDSYICENGHVLCRACNDIVRQKCSLCGGRIVRQTEFRLEGVPTAFFKNSVNEPVSSDDSDIGPTYRSESMSGGEEWHGRYSVDFDSEFGSTEKFSCCEDLSWNLNSPNLPLGDYYYMSFAKGEAGNRFKGNGGSINRQPERKGGPNTDFKENKSQANIKQSKSVCKFRTPSLDENYITGIPTTSPCDPKELYHKTMNGEVHFDPKQDYYKRVAQVNEIQEFYKRPNLEIARKSSSRMELKEKIVQSDSVTILEHLTEFRNATNYVPPEEIEVYKMKTDLIQTEPTIITKSRTTIPKDSSTDCSCREKRTKSKIHENGSEQNYKVDVSTVIDMCIEPCLNFLNEASSGLCAADFMSSKQISNKSNHDNNNGSSGFCIADFQSSKEISNKSKQSKETNGKGDGDIDQKEDGEITAAKEENQNSLPQSQKNLGNLLREKLRSEVYSQFEKSPAQHKNNFITKTRYKPSPLVALHVDSFKDMSRTNIYEIINQEIEKFKWSAPDDTISPSQRREEIIKQSKNQVREQLLQQIYANFDQRQDSARSTTTQSKTEPSLGELSPREIPLDNEINCKDLPTAIENITARADGVTPSIEALISNCTCHPQNKAVRTVALSTESYPKLNPQLIFLNAPRVKEQQSSSTFNLKGATESKCDCNSQPLCEISTIHTPTDAEKEIISEIQKQFQTQQRQMSSQRLEVVKLASQSTIPSLTNTSTVVAVGGDKNFDIIVTNNGLDCDTNSKTVGADDSPGINLEMCEESQISKLSEGPFIQSTAENPFQSQLEPNFGLPKENIYSPVEREITVATMYQTENVVQHVNYPENSVPNEEFPESIGDDRLKEFAKNLAKDYREEPQNESQTSLDISDFILFLKEKFPNISLKQIKEILINLPSDYCDHTAELGTDISQRDTADSKNNLLPSVDTSVPKQVDTTENLSTFSSITANAWRAFYSPPSIEEETPSEPTPQFKIISRLDLEGSCLENSMKGIRPAAELNIPRSPVICPISTCNKLIFVSEFSKHIKVDHVKIPVESISPGKCKNLFLDPKVDHHGINKCHILYLVTDKIRDLGSREYKDFLPVLVMSTKVSLLELICSEFRPRSREVIRSRQNYYMIWLTGLSPTDLPIYFSLTAWSRYGPVPKCHIVHSGKLYSIRNGQDARTLFKNGQVLLLSHEQCSMLTNEGRNMIELQVVVH